MSRSLLLSSDWDLCLTSSGRIAVTDGSYATAQRVANAVRLFVDDAYFNATKGVPHYSLELGRIPPEGLLKGRLRRAALDVTGVVDAVVTFSRFEERVLSGGIRLTLDNGETAHVAL